MKTISSETITLTVRDLCLKANFRLRADVSAALRRAYNSERTARARKAIKAILDNSRIAAGRRLAICQDTGLPIVIAALGQDVRIGCYLDAAIQRGVVQGYSSGYFRPSIVADPLARGRPGFGPAIIHVEIVPGSSVSLTVLPKGFGCENKSRLAMFDPTTPVEEIKKFIVEAVRHAGPDACPPYVVGVGIGGTADYACWLAKKALLRRIKPVTSGKARTSKAMLEKDLLARINKLAIGPMGLGGVTTALAVHVETAPTHIAGLPVAVNIGCHATRSASAVIK